MDEFNQVCLRLDPHKPRDGVSSWHFTTSRRGDYFWKQKKHCGMIRETGPIFGASGKPCTATVPCGCLIIQLRILYEHDVLGLMCFYIFKLNEGRVYIWDA